MLSATGKPISVYSEGVNWKQNKESQMCIFPMGNIWEDSFYMQRLTEHQMNMPLEMFHIILAL